jgi:hypothetical protein
MSETKSVVRYDNNYLQQYCKENGIELLKDYSTEKVNRDTIIEAKCLMEGCDKNIVKSFRNLTKNKVFLCEPCGKINMIEKVKEKLDIHFDTIKNNNNISKNIDEEWKIIPDNTDYSVSNYGNVKNNKRNTLINGYKYKSGYMCIKLGKTKTHYSIHRIVGELFIPNPENKPTINHKNKQREDNRVCNLEWATITEQNIHKNVNTKITHKINNTNQNNKNIDNELWKSIYGYEMYEISNMGRIKMLNGKIRNSFSDFNGYCSIRLKSGDISKSELVHRLVANTFIPNPENKPIVNHIDSNKKNNNINNLEWTNMSENISHAYNTGTHNQASKIIQYNKDKIKIQEFNSINDASRKLNICASTLSKLCRKKYSKTNLYNKLYYFEYI